MEAFDATPTSRVLRAGLWLASAAGWFLTSMFVAGIGRLVCER